MLLLTRIGDGVRALIGVCEIDGWCTVVCRVDGGSSLPLDQPAGRVELEGRIAQSPGYHPNSPTQPKPLPKWDTVLLH